MCVAIFGDNVSMSLLYPFDFPSQMKNWLRVQGFASKLYYFGHGFLHNLFPLAVPDLSLRIVGVF